ncbi:MAG: hypothetical protein HY397_01905 [Candidatus Doudnabacteria bacterium]|nr:hypothetical protein [Candidatus Doudnabacteria bacterium]
MKELLLDLLGRASQLREHLGSRWCEEVQWSDLGKRQTRFERCFSQLLFSNTQLGGLGAIVEVEGWKPRVLGLHAPQYELFVDPMDGTANTCRWQDTGSRLIGSDVTAVIAVAPYERARPLLFADFFAAGAVDLRSAEGENQIWVAEKGRGAWTAANPKATLAPMTPGRNYHRHSPLVACEFFRHVNWATRLLVNQAIEWSDMASSFMNMLRVALGEADCYINNVLPEYSSEGQRGHELGALMPFLSELQGCALDARNRRPLGESRFTFDGMTPVIIGVDRETVDYYLGLINQSLETEIALPDAGPMPLRTLISAISKGLQARPGKLRPLGSIPEQK